MTEVVATLRRQLRYLASTDRMGKFVSVGAIGFVVDNVVLALCYGVFGLSLIVAKLIAAEAAIAVMFALNERWTFAAMGRSSARAVARRFVSSNIVRAGGVLVATTILVVLYEFAGVWYLVANVIGIGVGFVVNYTFESLVTWRVHRQ